MKDIDTEKDSRVVIEDLSLFRIWVDSEKKPWFARDGFRVLYKGKIIQRIGGQLFGKWSTIYDNLKRIDQICVLDTYEVINT